MWPLRRRPAGTAPRVDTRRHPRRAPLRPPTTRPPRHRQARHRRAPWPVGYGQPPARVRARTAREIRRARETRETRRFRRERAGAAAPVAGHRCLGGPSPPAAPCAPASALRSRFTRIVGHPTTVSLHGEMFHYSRKWISRPRPDHRSAPGVSIPAPSGRNWWTCRPRRARYLRSGYESHHRCGRYSRSSRLPPGVRTDVLGPGCPSDPIVRDPSCPRRRRRRCPPA